MPTKRRVQSAPAQESLPVDLLLEIVACSDVTTVVRFARTCRTLRIAILDPAFRRRLALKSAADGGGFDPGLLLGVSFLRHTVHRLIPASRVIHTPRRTKHRVRLDTTSRSVWKPFEPVASRGSLLLLRRKSGVYLPDHDAFHYELRVCNTFTGEITSLPPMAVSNIVYPYVFLSVGDGDVGGSYELLVADRRMRFQFQTFSSKYHQWGDVREATSDTKHPLYLRPSFRPAVVIGRIVYWLICALLPSDLRHNGILALDVDDQAVTTMDLPHGCFSTMTAYMKNKHLLLASVHGRVSLLLGESRGISMWTLAPTSSTATWSRELVIGMEEILEKPVGLASSASPFVLEGFGERSGAVIVRVVNSNQLLRLDLGTKVVIRLRNRGNASVTCLFLHEIDLVSFLQTMKPF